MLVTLPVIVDEQTNHGSVRDPLLKFLQGELPYERVGILFQSTEGPTPHLFVAVQTELDEPGVKHRQRTRSEHFEQVGDDSRLPRGPEELDDRLQISFVGAPPPAAQPEATLVCFGCVNNRFNWGGDHPLSV